MIGKLLIPAAIGGGLLLLLSSSAKAETAPRNPFDVLPSNLRVLAAQAQATNDPGLLEQTAAQLEMQGFVQAAGVLRMQADQIRRIRGGGAPTTTTPSAPQANPFDPLPENLRMLSAQAQATNDPGILEQMASQLEAQGFMQAASVLRIQANHARRPSGITAAQALPPPASAPVAAASGPPPFVATSGNKTQALSADLQKLVADAIANGTAPVLTSTAFVLERAGFQDVAEDLRRRAKEAAAKAPAPAQKDLPNVALDPSMPTDLAREVARQLQLQGDPAALEALARELRLRGFNNTADQVEAKAKQIRAMLDAARTMHDIDQEFKSPGVPPLPSGGAPSPQRPVQTLPEVTVTATPPSPLPVPAIPVPQSLPAERSKVQILADNLSTSLNNLIEQHGSVQKARYKEDQGTVMRFQTEARLTADGKYGPGTAAHVARYASDVPPPFYWKKGAGQKDLGIYRSNLEAIALDAEQLGNTDRAARLRASAARASLA